MRKQWFFDAKQTRISQDENDDVESCICTLNGDKQRRKITAPLIAAAPSLLSALEALVSDFEDVLPQLRKTGWETSNEEAMLKRARAAIFMAKGAA